jgi:virginiamycin B lyase
MGLFTVATRAAFAAAALLAALAACKGPVDEPGVTEFAIPYPHPAQAAAPGAAPPGGGMSHAGSTHEITFDERRGGNLWVTGQTHDSLVRVTPEGGTRIHRMPPGSGPHGIAFDAAGRLWITLEFHGRVQALDADGKVVADYPVGDTHPHGLGVAADGKTIWFTGKTAGLVGRIAPDGKVATFALPTAGSLPIYIRSGPDGNMWVTELTGNRIARVTADGGVTEFPIPTANSRPIAIVPGPDGAMWFTEEAGNKVGRIGRDGRITEFPVPKAQPNLILAGLAFDRHGNLWVQQHVDHNRPAPAGPDNIVRIARAGLAGGPSGLARTHFTFYPVPTRDTVMHRIIEGPDRNLWFTEMRADKVGRLVPGRARR